MKKFAKAVKVILCVLAVICLISFLISALASDFEPGHECTGEDCSVCMAISLREGTARLLLIFVGSAAIFAAPTLSAHTAAVTERLPFPAATPVCLKVKLSN